MPVRGSRHRLADRGPSASVFYVCGSGARDSDRNDPAPTRSTSVYTYCMFLIGTVTSSFPTRTVAFLYFVFELGPFPE